MFQRAVTVNDEDSSVMTRVYLSTSEVVFESKG